MSLIILQLKQVQLIISRFYLIQEMQDHANLVLKAILVILMTTEESEFIFLQVLKCLVLNIRTMFNNWILNELLEILVLSLKIIFSESPIQLLNLLIPVTFFP